MGETKELRLLIKARILELCLKLGYRSINDVFVKETDNGDFFLKLYFSFFRSKGSQGFFVNCLTGVGSHKVNQLRESIFGEKSGYLKWESINSQQIGYFLPENTYTRWHILNNNDIDNFINEIELAITQYFEKLSIESYMSYTNLLRMSKDINEIDRFLPLTMHEFIPILYYLCGEYDNGSTFIIENEIKYFEFDKVIDNYSKLHR